MNLKFSFLRKNSTDFCEGCSFLGLGESSGWCILCKNNHLNEDLLANLKFWSRKNIFHRKHIWYYYETLDALSNKYCQNSSAGWFITALLDELLSLKKVDYVLNVSFDAEDKKFKYTKVTDPIQLYKTQRSVYYPINFKHALDIIDDNPGTCAITWIPSVIKAIEILKINIPRYQDKIKYTIGLTYHSTKTPFYLDYLCKKAGKNDWIYDVDFISFRDKGEAIDYKTSGDFVVRTKTEEWRLGSRDRGLDWSIGLLQDFSSHFVDDHFWELADISVMDAWHKNYRLTKWVSLCIIRDQELNSIIKSSHNIVCNAVDASVIMDSQKSGIISKTRGLQIRLAFFNFFNDFIPQRRVLPSFCLNKPLFLMTELFRIYLSVSSISKFKKFDNVADFEKSMRLWKSIYRFFYKLYLILWK